MAACFRWGAHWFAAARSGCRTTDEGLSTVLVLVPVACFGFHRQKGWPVTLRLNWRTGSSGLVRLRLNLRTGRSALLRVRREEGWPVDLRLNWRTGGNVLAPLRISRRTGKKALLQFLVPRFPELGRWLLVLAEHGATPIVVPGG